MRPWRVEIKEEAAIVYERCFRESRAERRGLWTLIGGFLISVGIEFCLLIRASVRDGRYRRTQRVDTGRRILIVIAPQFVAGEESSSFARSHQALSGGLIIQRRDALRRVSSTPVNELRSREKGAESGENASRGRSWTANQRRFLLVT